MRLPELKKINTFEMITQIIDLDAVGLERSVSSVLGGMAEWAFEDAFGLIYRVQDSMQNIIRRGSFIRNPAIYRVLFRKSEMNRINVFLKMEFIK